MTRDSRRVSSIDQLFARRLKAVRQALDLTAKQLSDDLGKHTRFIHGIEAARPGRQQRPVSLGEAVEICELLRVPLAVMVDPDQPLASIIALAKLNRLPKMPVP